MFISTCVYDLVLIYTMTLVGTWPLLYDLGTFFIKIFDFRKWDSNCRSIRPIDVIDGSKIWFGKQKKSNFGKMAMLIGVKNNSYTQIKPCSLQVVGRCRRRWDLANTDFKLSTWPDWHHVANKQGQNVYLLYHFDIFDWERGDNWCHFNHYLEIISARWSNIL